MTTKRPTDIIRQQREDIDQTLREFHAAADGIKYRRDLSDEGKHDARRALRDQYLANLTSDAAAGWTTHRAYGRKERSGAVRVLSDTGGSWRVSGTGGQASIRSSTLRRFR
jgi:hypothetical protein